VEKDYTICKKCSHYKPKEGVCDVVILHRGEALEISVKPNDKCAWKEFDMLDYIKKYEDPK